MADLASPLRRWTPLSKVDSCTHAHTCTRARTWRSQTLGRLPRHLIPASIGAASRSALMFMVPLNLQIRLVAAGWIYEVDWPDHLHTKAHVYKHTRTHMHTRLFIEGHTEPAVCSAEWTQGQQSRFSLGSSSMAA